ncbi:MAG: sensor histidine kinase [Draconibacterium sp.]
MKLLTRTSLNFLSISLFIFLLGLMVFYFLLRKQVDANINAELIKKENAIRSELNTAHGTEKTPQSPADKVVIVPAPTGNEITHMFKDTVLFDAQAQHYIPHRQLEFPTEINGQKYRVKIYKSLAETDSLIIRILLLLTVVVVMLIAALLVLNLHTSQKAWRVFYDTLEKVSHYDLNSQQEFSPQASDIKEFSDLNLVLTSMTDRIKNDYYNLKEYTENASHEIQTPLAVITSKLELLLQSDKLPEKELKTITDALEASSKLSRLNKTLLLLAKIENRQFPETKEVDLLELINNQLENFEELIENKQIQVKLPETSRPVKMNPFLADIMIANLIKNGLRHNVKGGKLEFDISEERLIVSNSGEKIQGDEEQLFTRFYKASSSDKSTGLGLAIVQKICEVSGFRVQYAYRENLHQFSIFFG